MASLRRPKRPPFVVEKLLVYLLVAFYLVFTLLTIREQRVLMGYCATVNDCVSYYSLRLLVVLTFIIVSVVRNKRWFDVPFVRDMTEPIYWRVALLMILFLQPLIPYHSEAFSSNPEALKNSMGFRFMMVTYLSLTLLADIQQQVWARDRESLRRQRIDLLLRKAHLKKDERDFVLNLDKQALNEIHAKHFPSPWIWRIALSLLSLVLAATLNSYSTNILDFIDDFVPFRNLLPPF